MAGSWHHTASRRSVAHPDNTMASLATPINQACPGASDRPIVVGLIMHPLPVRFPVILVSISILSGCFCGPDIFGGHASPCNLKSKDGWTPGIGNSLDYPIRNRLLTFSTQHLYYYPDEPATIIDIHVYDKKSGLKKGISYSPQDAYIQIGERRISANPTLRETPALRSHWTCNGVIPNTGDLGKCETPVLTFDVQIPPGAGFRVHYGSLVVDGDTIPIPDVDFCYAPKRIAGWSCYKG
jgi:hypothetical protein